MNEGDKKNMESNDDENNVMPSCAAETFPSSLEISGDSASIMDSIHEDHDGFLGNLTAEDLLLYSNGDDQNQNKQGDVVECLENPQSPNDDGGGGGETPSTTNVARTAVAPAATTTPHRDFSAKRKKTCKGSPKRPLSAYNLFFKAFRAKLAESGTSLSFARLGQEVARNWRELSPSEHYKFEDMAGQDLKRYRREMKAFKKSEAQSEAEKVAKKRHPTSHMAPAGIMRTGSQVSPHLTGRPTTTSSDGTDTTIPSPSRGPSGELPSHHHRHHRGASAVFTNNVNSPTHNTLVSALLFFSYQHGPPHNLYFPITRIPWHNGASLMVGTVSLYVRSSTNCEKSLMALHGSFSELS